MLAPEIQVCTPDAPEDISLEACLCEVFGEEVGRRPLPLTGEETAEYVRRILEAGTARHWREMQPEIAGGGPNGLGMMLVRRRQQLVYSLKFSNFLRDPFLSFAATSLSVFGVFYTEEVMGSLPPTYPGFVIGLAFTVLRAFAHPVGYGEAALLHWMIGCKDRDAVVSSAELRGAGPALVSKYGYVKGSNGNEVEALLASLMAWRAIERRGDHYYVRESVPFGLGPPEYA